MIASGGREEGGVDISGCDGEEGGDIGVDGKHGTSEDFPILSCFSKSLILFLILLTSSFSSKKSFIGTVVSSGLKQKQNTRIQSCCQNTIQSCCQNTYNSNVSVKTLISLQMHTI